ncbi:hypothetical protein [Neorhodopirellula pilleata]|uniref:Uncharacterized protein n=1 Tax=Neorhodopirellula pilleata TaxID=2714738 RepID=A0A5C5ZYK9_9BACT|nr:hypothetical protein [Neorhodopirellula pilleata]TWT92276.1 hypothetical protein Pla100_48140 [Neorhodopirellula pilleata]
MSHRKGSAIVLAILAIAVVSLAGVTIVRSHRRMNFRQSAVQARTQGRLIAHGLVHREIAFRRVTPSGPTAPIDQTLSDFPLFENAQCIANNVDVANQMMDTSVILYPGGPPADVRQRLDIGN